MLKQFILGASALVTTAVAMPAEAEARHRYQRGDYYGQHDPYYRGGYDRSYYGQGYYNQGYYGQGYGNRGYYGRRAYRDYDRGYYGRRRCGSGTTGAIVGGAAGALLGREVGRNGRRYYRGRGNGTVGAIIGGGVGALIGREIGRSC